MNTNNIEFQDATGQAVPEMLPYNTDMKPLRLNEYGRNIQNMVSYCMTIEDRDERTACAYEIANIIARLFPTLVGEKNDYSQIWDQINIMSDFSLDIDFPCEVVTADKIHPQPEKIPYTSGQIRYRHYGKSIEKMIDIAAGMPEGEEKDSMVSLLANYMKKLMLTHNKEGVDDAKILRDLAEYSNGRIVLDPHTYILNEITDVPVNNQPKRRKKK